MINSTDYIKNTTRDFSIYTAQNRAIPSICDGFKDGQRKVMWVIRSKSDKIKTISLAGSLIESNLYNHGDASAADTISNLAGLYVNNIPMLEGIGNFGTKVAPNDFGAPRYTYVKKNSVSNDLVYPDINIIPLKENYDGSAMEPKNFLPLIPLVLLNGISGIAVGWSTDILPRKVTDIIDASIAALEGKKIKRLIPTYTYADCTVNHIEDNSWEFLGKIKVVDTSTVKITELPPGLTLDKFRSTLNNLEDNGTINSYTDRSTKVIDVTIKFPRSTLKGLSDDKIINILKLRKKQTERIVVLDFNNESIKQYDYAEDLIKDFVNWRLGWYKIRYEDLKAKAETNKRFYEALKLCFDKKLPAKLSTIKDKKEIEDVIAAICSKMDLTDQQLDRISSLPSYRWSKESYQDILLKITELEKDIKEYNDILSSDKRMKDIYLSELKELKSKKF